jgi:hypothetical protein
VSGSEEQYMTPVYHPVALRINAHRRKWIFDMGMTYYPYKNAAPELIAVEI